MPPLSGSSLGPFTTNTPDAVTATTSVVIVSNLPFGSLATGKDRQRLTRSTSAPLSGPGISPGIRPVIRDRPLEEQHYGPGFLLPFSHRHSLVGPSCSRQGLGPSLRSAYQHLLDPDGVSVFHTRERRPGSGAPSAPRRWCPHGC